MVVMCNFISDLFERIGNEAANVCRFSKKQTLSSREVQTAVRLILPGELANGSQILALGVGRRREKGLARQGPVELPSPSSPSRPSPYPRHSSGFKT